MRGTMRTLYSVATDHGGAWEGDCARWAAEMARSGMVVRRVRVRWFGPVWPCGACQMGTHAR